MYLHSLSTLSEQMPIARDTALIMMLVIGLGLWLLGGVLARLTCTVLGLAGGLGVGLIIAAAIHSHGMGELVIFLCGLIGMGFAWLLFRVWMSLSLATVLAAAAPVALLVWHGALITSDPQSAPIPITRQMVSTRQVSIIPIGNQDQRSFDTVTPAAPPGGSKGGFIPANALPPLSQVDASVIEETRTQCILAQTWWLALTPDLRHMVLTLAGGGAILGLLIGLIWPKFSAAVMSSLLGSVLILGAGLRLAATSMPAIASPALSNPRVLLVLIGLITLTGVCIQWAISRPPTDKEKE